MVFLLSQRAGAYANVIEDFFVLTFVALQPCALRGRGLLQHVHPAVGI